MVMLKLLLLGVLVVGALVAIGLGLIGCVIAVMIWRNDRACHESPQDMVEEIEDFLRRAAGE